MSVPRFTLPLVSAAAVLLFSTAASAGPPPPPPTEGVAGGNTRPTSTGVRPPPPAARPPSSNAPSRPAGDPLIDQRTPTKDFSTNWGYASEGDARPNYVRPEREAALSINPIGFYQGVTVGGENLPPFAPETLGGAAVMTWTGFEGERGGQGSRVFLQLSSAVDHHLVQQPEMVTLRLPNTSVNVKNNARSLDTSYFITPVAGLVISRDGPDTVVKIRLRRPATATASVQPAANGYKLLVVQFPIETGVVTEPTPAPAPAPPAPQS